MIKTEREKVVEEGSWEILKMNPKNERLIALLNLCKELMEEVDKLRSSERAWQEIYDEDEQERYTQTEDADDH